MDSLKQLNFAMRYIEDNLDNEIDFTQVAQRACCSEYHFRRMFSFLSGMTLSDYIRRRRLSQAAVDLQQSDLKVIDIAVKYGYTSADAFTRAFQALHGLTPTEARADNTSLKMIPPITFQLTIHGGNPMDYRIVEKEPFYIVGLHRRIKLVYKGINPEAADMFKSLTEDDIRNLKALSDIEPHGLLSVSTHFTEGREEGSQFDQFVGIATTQSSAGKWSVLPVKALTWAVFTVKGEFPKVLQETWGRIYAEWFPNSGYEAVDGPSMVWTKSKDLPLTDYHNEIWIPVRKV